MPGLRCLLLLLARDHVIVSDREETTASDERRENIVVW